MGAGVDARKRILTAVDAPPERTTEIIACGIPAIAWISHSSQLAENYGGDTNAPTNATHQVVPVTTVIGK